MKILLIVCDSCREPQIIDPKYEPLIDTIESVICLRCGHEHKDLNEFKKYVKETAHWNGR